ncbi:ribbon-helix-helix CopG family protein [Hydrogenivirga caldilitoris]|uniref:Ribbon-helix-helix CopG family protein n=1 Tax=Hydrogenivirga caldilitoris TaxID=246264 RepID=A0A497XQQ0_9AQUI|nr:ribbon-helix-helix protein, CopG family [Hydrogenivirga caldilitoris]RLJ70469.1 ribbon-helix-helix CopG family protein [Hydrogenivirga caldilitoris]
MKGVISFRLEPSLLEELDRVSKEEGKTRTGIIKEAIRYYLQHIHRKNNSEGFVPFLEYRKVNEELKETLRRVSELEARIAELSKENELLKRDKKRRWFF